MSIAPTRLVTIDPNVNVHEILSIHHYTASEINAAWYDEEEMDKITERCFKILQKYETGSQNSSKYCMRGLESHTSSGSISKGYNRSASFEAVFEVQERQWHKDEEGKTQAISYAYQRITSSCQMWAQVVGSRDQQAVEAYLYEDNDEEEISLARPFADYSSSKRQTSSCLKRGSNISRKQPVTALLSARAA